MKKLTLLAALATVAVYPAEKETLYIKIGNKEFCEFVEKARLAEKYKDAMSSDRDTTDRIVNFFKFHLITRPTNFVAVQLSEYFNKKELPVNICQMPVETIIKEKGNLADALNSCSWTNALLNYDINFAKHNGGSPAAIEKFEKVQKNIENNVKILNDKRDQK